MKAVGLGWVWADGRRALQGVDLQIQPGQRVLITGPSGGGKSTLLRLLGGLLPAHGLGVMEGELHAVDAGFVFQDPGDQLLTGSVGAEVGLAAEARGRQVEVEAQLARVGLSIPTARRPDRLSGGQQQRLVTAAALAGGQRWLMLDEPLAHLDPDGRARLLRVLRGLTEAGRGVLLVEHRLEESLDWAERVIVVVDGAVVFDGAEVPPELLTGDGLSVSPLGRVDTAGGLRGPALPPRVSVGDVVFQRPALPVSVEGRPLFELPVLAVHRGERIAVMGPNGIGKSTLLSSLVGDRVIAVPQDPDLALFCSTVREELEFGARERGLPPSVTPADIGLEGREEAAPQGLSRGQRLRLAVGAALACAPDVLVLDEPTAGQHREAVDGVFALLETVPAVVFATHDVELALRWATRVWVLGAKGLVADGPPDAVLGHTRLPPLQREQVRRGWPLACAEVQLATAGQGRPVVHPEYPVLTGRSEPSEPPPASVAPLVGLLLVLTCGSLAVLLDAAASLGLLAAISVGTLLLQPITARRRMQVLGTLVAVVWATLLSQGLFYGDQPRTAWLSLGPLTLYREGLLWGWVQSLRLVAVTAAGLSLALACPPDRLLRAVRALRVPGGLAFLGVTALRFVPVVAGEWSAVRRARRARGRPVWSRGPLAWLTMEIGMIRPLVARSLRRAHRLAETLDARGVRVASIPLAPEPWTLGSRLTAVMGGGVVLTVATLQILQGAYLYEIYRRPEWAGLYAWVRTWL